MATSKPVLTPISFKQYLSAHDGELLSELILYRYMVSALQYAIMTRFDISFVVNLVIQYMHQQRLPHIMAFKRILRYLDSTKSFGILLDKHPRHDLHAYVDADWDSFYDTKHSTSRFCIFFSQILCSGRRKTNICSNVKHLGWIPTSCGPCSRTNVATTITQWNRYVVTHSTHALLRQYFSHIAHTKSRLSCS